MAWMITLVSGVSQLNDNMVGIIEEESAAHEVGPVLLEIYNREFPEYSHFVVTEVVDPDE